MTLTRLAKLLWTTGGVLCLMVFLYQATPILLTALETIWLAPAGVFLLLFGAGILTLCAVFLFTWLSEELEDRRSFLRTRRRMREIALLIRERELQHLQKHHRYRTSHAAYKQARHKLWRHFKRGKM